MVIDWARIGEDLIGRITGPMQFRLLLQPAMALYFAIRDGMKDAREGRPAYFWSILSTSRDRGGLLKEGLRAVGRVFVLGIVMDAIYQWIELRTFYPGEAILVALILAFIPYLLMRGPANRIARWWSDRHIHHEPGYGRPR